MMPRYTGQDTGILTFHRTHNFGAFLQAYAMAKTLAEAGYTPQLIDYQEKTHWLNESWPVIRKFRRPIRLIDFLRKHRAFGKTLSSLSLTPYTRRPADLLELHIPRVVVGSDIVWNYLIHGCESPFFGAVSADRLISYAPSFGWASLSDPPPRKLAECLNRFDAISVRDDNSQQIVKSLTGRDAPIVLDPTFLHDCNGDEKRPQESVLEKPYMLVYAFDMTEEMAAQIRGFADAHDLTVIGVGYRLAKSPCDRMLMGLSPFEFLWAVKHAAYIFTNTFHGSIFSIKYAKAFGVSMGPSVQPKLEPLLHRLGLMSRTLTSDTDLGDVLEADEDFESAHAQLASEAKQSRHWLTEALAS